MNIFVFVLIIFLVSGCSSTHKRVFLMEYEKIDINDIESLTINSDKDGTKEIVKQSEIRRQYNYLNSFYVGRMTNKTCQDNTVYIFNLGNREIVIEIECDMLVVNDKRYILIKKKER